ncbi:MAG TPA: hypothetical protein VJS44_12790 [Pyrinomonadaceae bacterium]|nr:hypothetical protein [Pyrinomonadaceae bacterium]
MRSKYFSSPWHRLILMALGLWFLLAAAPLASGQCFQNPTGETALGLQNASSYYLIFYIDGVNKGGVPPGDRSVDFVVTPGEHALRVDALVGNQIVSAQRIATIPEGYVCAWTVTDPPQAFRPVKKGQVKETGFGTRRRE